MRILLGALVLALVATAFVPSAQADSPVSCQSGLTPPGDGFVQDTYRGARDFYNSTCQPLVDFAYQEAMDAVCFAVGC